MFPTQSKPVVTRITNKFQVTVPPEMRDLFDLRVDDLFEWDFDEHAEAIRIIPKRAQLLTPQVRATIGEIRTLRSEHKLKAPK